MKKFLFAIICLHTLTFAQQQISKPKYDVFNFEKTVSLPGTPEQVYDLATGDISGWWDHSFSEKPKKFFIEPKPGGGFYEIFDDEGNGVLHATVIYAQRGKMLRFDGPLGLSGLAVKMVTTYSFEKVGNDSTLMKVEIHGSGEIAEGIPSIVEKVWEHFIFERFKPYVEKVIKK
ncbi:MAG: SRPBCC domain-containing protein [Ignavibacterium sp.]|uniref:SRPBCC domain-containing protein n=1 Tax=Ignavibacterium sp. TaxID=2651167 RepID=UPI003299F0E2